MKWDVGHLYDYPYFSLGKYLVTTGERRALMIEYSGTRMPIFFGSFLLLVVGAPAGGLWVLFSLEASQQRLIILFAAILCPLSFISFHCGRMIFMILPRGVRAAAAVIRWQFLFTFMVPIIAGLTMFIVGGVNLHEDKVMLTTFCAIAVFPIASTISWMIMAIKHFEHISNLVEEDTYICYYAICNRQVGFSAWLPSLCSLPTAVCTWSLVEIIQLQLGHAREEETFFVLTVCGLSLTSALSMFSLVISAKWFDYIRFSTDIYDALP